MTSAQLINATSGKVEYFSPPEIVAAARRVMGSIELDPASSAAANQHIGADRFYTVYDDAIKLEWRAKTLWLNHPFGRAEAPCAPDCAKDHEHHDEVRYGNATWINKLRDSIGWDKVAEACCITFAATSEAWFQPLLGRPICFLCPRTNYYLPDGTILKGVSKGSAVTYFGKNVAAFAREFSKFGTVKVSYVPLAQPSFRIYPALNL